jgi:DNA primase large subunit
MIYEQLTAEKFAEALTQDEYSNMSYRGALALYDYFEEIGEDIELDVVAIRCDYHEYETRQELLDDYDAHTWEEIQDNTEVIEVKQRDKENSVIIRQF